MSELPKSLEEAIAQSRVATQAALADGQTRLQVEFLFPELKFMLVAEDYLPVFAEYGSGLKVFFADAGAAALARNQWKDAAFKITDIGTGRANAPSTKIKPEDEIFLFIAPTSVEVPQMEKLMAEIGDRPVIFLNPRLEDYGVVGLGYAARQVRQRFIGNIESCYYLRPVDDQTAVFRCYPGQWSVWVEKGDEYQKIAELATKPSGDDLDLILMKGQPQTAIDTAPAKKPSVLKGLQRFLKALSS
ncbi:MULTISPECIES: DUF1995 family protein [Calothrix]|uniref:DUF1995 family protein n=2 Tax=Calothrix TaxID=1186 RepID=A0ABR8A282_9CYAN|nr:MULTISPECIES: DUF1995 family protein [Calothrix]MBD2194061.1 DUF1995 family protein [Calothrix parietina FACHB-288]MBD2223068.1 DUF1995 family protein [Calothrix anomala FACHB-343]